MRDQSGIQIPGELVKHVTSMCGERGERWLADLPATIAKLESEWSVTIGEPFEAGEFNFVASALRGADRTVIKICPPFETVEIFGEADFLRSRDGVGAVRLLNEDRERQAIMIEYASPGKTLAEIFAGNESGAIDPAIGVLKKILSHPGSATPHAIKLDDWFDGLRRFSSTKFPSRYAVRALSIYEKLSTQAELIFYLHGDFHPANVVSATREPYLAIDPKGMVGHLGYDIAVFLNNYHWWQETEPDIRSRLAHAVNRFSVAFGIPEIELREWAFAQMVLGAWWTFDEMPELYNNEVAKADIWDV